MRWSFLAPGLAGGLIAVLACATASVAAPIVGEFNIAGTAYAETTQGDAAALGTARVLDFRSATVVNANANVAMRYFNNGAFNATNNSGNFLVVLAEGDFADLASVGDQGQIKDLPFKPASTPFTPITNFYTINQLSFDLMSLTIKTASSGSANSLGSLVLSGSGIFRHAGYDNTAGAWSLTLSTVGTKLTGAFAFAANAIVEPAPVALAIAVPEPASLAILASALLGLGLARRSRRHAIA